MKEPNWSSCTEEQLWKYVAFHLAKEGIDSVLVGGAVVAIYSAGAYRSGDLDFIVPDEARVKLDQAMLEIGFNKQGRHYVHPQCQHLFVDMPPGPLAIGDDYKIKPQEVSVGKKLIRILSPTDCIRDRLVSYIHWKTRDALDQAVLVAKSSPYDSKTIKKWCAKEKFPEVFEEFIRLVD